MESLRGMKGVVASSGWGVARFIVLELGETRECSACLTSAWKATGGNGVIILWHSRVLLCLKRPGPQLWRHKGQKRKLASVLHDASFVLRASREPPSNTANSSRECAESHASEARLPALSTSAPRSDISDPVSTCML